MFKPGSGIFGRELARWRTPIIDALHDLGGGDAALLGVSGIHLDQARRANCSIAGSATLPAWQRYTGVVWDHFDPATLSDAARERARRSVVVLSGLLGLVGFDDPVPDYKLKIGAALDLPGPSGARSRIKLAAYWRNHSSAILDEWIGRRTVIDLLPQEHRRSWSPTARVDIVTVSFVDRRNRTAGHDAKAAKGSFVRHIVSARSPLRALESWEHPEYRAVLSTGR